MGFQVEAAGLHGFLTGFFITLAFGLVVFLFQTVCYIVFSKQFVSSGRTRIEDYQSPIDIWLAGIPICIMMMVSYGLLHWYLVQVFFCTMLSLIGTLLGSGLGRGSNKWMFRRSLPFFTGVIASTLFLWIMEWMV